MQEFRRALPGALARLAVKQIVRRDSAGAMKSLPVVQGYAAVFSDGSPETEFIMDDWGSTLLVERMMPGCFDRAVREQDVACLVNHDPNMLVGRTSSKTCKLTIDKRGLLYTLTPSASPLWENLLSWVQRGDMSGSSFGFSVPQGGAKFREEKRSNGKTITYREVYDVDVFDIGPVTYPAYAGATVGMKGGAAGRSAQRRIPDRITARLRVLEIQQQEIDSWQRIAEQDEKARQRQLTDAEAIERRWRAEAMQPRVTRAEVLARVRQLERMGL